MLRFLNYKIVGNRLIFLNRKVRLEKNIYQELHSLTNTKRRKFKMFAKMFFF